jgi:hypothetical protein
MNSFSPPFLLFDVAAQPPLLLSYPLFLNSSTARHKNSIHDSLRFTGNALKLVKYDILRGSDDPSTRMARHSETDDTNSSRTHQLSLPLPKSQFPNLRPVSLSLTHSHTQTHSHTLYTEKRRRNINWFEMVTTSSLFFSLSLLLLSTSGFSLSVLQLRFVTYC